MSKKTGRREQQQQQRVSRRVPPAPYPPDLQAEEDALKARTAVLRAQHAELLPHIEAATRKEDRVAAERLQKRLNELAAENAANILKRKDILKRWRARQRAELKAQP